MQPVKKSRLGLKRAKMTQCFYNRCKDLFERKKYFGVRCTLSSLITWRLFGLCEMRKKFMLSMPLINSVTRTISALLLVCNKKNQYFKLAHASKTARISTPKIFYKITEPLCSLSLVNRCFKMRVCKHGCDVSDLCVFLTIIL